MKTDVEDDSITVTSRRTVVFPMEQWCDGCRFARELQLARHGWVSGVDLCPECIDKARSLPDVDEGDARP